jgi:predicted ATPase
MEISLKNLRTFVDETNFFLSPITFLVGENSTGKTSFLATFSALSRPGFPMKIDFNVDPYDMGSFENIATNRRGRIGNAKEFEITIKNEKRQSAMRCVYSEKLGLPFLKSIKITQEKNLIEIEFGEEIQASFRLSKPNFNRKIVALSKDVAPINILGFEDRLVFLLANLIRKDTKSQSGITENAFFKHLNTLQAILNTVESDLRPVRSIAPIRTKPKRTYDEVKDQFKSEGDHVPILISRILDSNDRRKNDLLSALEEYGLSSGLFKSVGVRRWRKTINSPFQIYVKVAGRETNITDVGYGVSQALPVLVESILANVDETVVIQQPEVHLHPKAQAALGSFVVSLNKRRNQKFIIETHSDYMIDRVRTEIRSGRIKSEDVTLLYFERDDFKTKVHKITYDSQGNLLDVPEGYRRFFIDEQMKVLGIDE